MATTSRKTPIKYGDIIGALKLGAYIGLIFGLLIVGGWR